MNDSAYSNSLSAADARVTSERGGLADLYSKRICPTSGWSDMGTAEHFVQFYETDDFIANSIAEYVIHGLRSNEVCILAATGDHLIEVERIINSFTSGLETARSEGRYISLDAAQTLASLMVDGMPDPDLVASIIEEILDRAGERGSRIRVFGEMVGVLCAQGNYAAALRLEDLWNGLRRKHRFSLFCAYPMAALTNDATGEHMSGICHSHGRVIPDESYTSLTSADERLRAISMLQQRTKQLEAEVAQLQDRVRQAA